MQIAIDGPAGAGKSTVAKKLAQDLGLLYLDTGAMYRAIAYGVKKRGCDPADEEAVLGVLGDLCVDVRLDGTTQRTFLNDEDVSEAIRTPEIGLAASTVAKIPRVRERLVCQQREIASRCDIVMDGRDIASYVLPHADFKIFLTATPRARALRRCGDLGLSDACDVEKIEQQILKRDEQDMNRKFAPLCHTHGEILIDTSEMTLGEVVSHLESLISGTM